MDSFAKWLIEQPSNANSDLAALQTVAKDPASKWPYWSNRLSDYLPALNAIAPAPANLAKLRDALEDAFAAWLRGPQTVSAKRGFWELFFANIGAVALWATAIAFFAVISIGLWNSGFYASLADPNQARGLLTFVVVLTATVVILVLAIAIFAFGDTPSLKERIAPAKDVLTVVIGVLGTIMGFYFGSANERTVLPLAVSSIEAPATAKAGTPIDVIAKISGGQPPYTVSIGGSDEAGASAPLLQPKESSSDVKEKVTLPQGAKGKIKLTITVKDKKGESKDGSRDLTIQP